MLQTLPVLWSPLIYLLLPFFKFSRPPAILSFFTFLTRFLGWSYFFASHLIWLFTLYYLLCNIFFFMNLNLLKLSTLVCAYVCVCACVCVCVYVCVCLYLLNVKASSVWNSLNVSERINVVVLKTFLSSAKSLLRYFRIKHRTILTNYFILFTH